MSSLVTRRTALGVGLAAAAVATLPACSSKEGAHESGAAGSKTRWPTYLAPRLVEGAYSPAPKGLPPIYSGPVKEYFASVEKTPGEGQEITTLQMLWGAPPQGKDRNKFWQALEKKLNITYKPTFQSLDTFSDKLATIVASGSIPDICFLIDDHAAARQALEDGAFADLTDVLAGDNIKRWPNLANIPTQVWKNSSKKGRIMGIPPEVAPVNVMTVVRDDIMKAAGWSEMPKDADDFLAMIKALASMKKYQGKQFWPLGTLEWNNQKFFEGMFRIGPSWTVKDGKVVSALEHENFPKLIEFLRKVQQAGGFHPDGFGAASKEPLFVEGQLVMTQNGPSGFAGFLQEVPRKTPGATLRLSCPRAFDGGDPEFIAGQLYWGLNAISATAAENEKKLHQLLDILNYWRAPYGSQEALFINNGEEGVHYKFDDQHNIVRIASDTDKADQSAIAFLGVGGQPVWVVPREHSDKVKNLAETGEKYLKAAGRNPLIGLTAPSDAKLSAKLAALDSDYRVGVILGRRPVSDIQAYKDAYFNNGGATLRQELQKLYEEREAAK